MAPKRKNPRLEVVAKRPTQEKTQSDGEGYNDDAAAPAAGPKELDACKPLDILQMLTAVQLEQHNMRALLQASTHHLHMVYRHMTQLQLLLQPPPHVQAPGHFDPALAATETAAAAQHGQQQQLPPHLHGPKFFDPVDLFRLAGASASVATETAAAAQHGQQQQLPPHLPGLGLFNPADLETAGTAGAAQHMHNVLLTRNLQGPEPNPFGLAGASLASTGSVPAGGGLGGGGGLGCIGNPDHCLFQALESRRRAARLTVAAEIAAVCDQLQSGSTPGLPPPAPTNVPAVTKGETKGGRQGHSLALWPEIEGLHLLPGQKPWTKDPETLDDLLHLFCSGVKVGDSIIVPPWSTLYSLHGEKWYPANDKSLRKRLGELKHLHDTCIKDTAKLRSCTPEEAASFWTGKQREHAALAASGKLQALKVYWESIVNPLRKDRAKFEAYVAKHRPPTFMSPTKEVLERKRASTSGEQGAGPHTTAGPSVANGAPVPAAPAVEEQPLPESLKKAPRSGHQMFVSHEMRTAGVKLNEAVQRWKDLQPAEQDEWNQKCAAAKQAFKRAAAKTAL